MRARSQAIQVMVTLVGPQDVDVTAHRPRTDGAAIGVRVGGALVYLADAATAVAFAGTWRAGGRDARRLPVRASPDHVATGLPKPAVMMEATGSPPSRAHLHPGTDRHPARLWVTLGRITFEVRDQEALISTAGAFDNAARLARSAFLPTAQQRAAQRAASAADRLLRAPASGQDGRRRVPARPGAAFSATAPRRRSGPERSAG